MKLQNKFALNVLITPMIATALLTSCADSASIEPAQSENNVSPQASQISGQSSQDIPAEPEVTQLLNLDPLNITSVRTTNPDAQITNLVDGRVVLGSNFEALGTGDGCTSSLIGPNVLVTAAHCVDGNGQPAVVRGIAFSPRANISVRLNYACTMHPTYQNAPHGGSAPRSSHDIALCVLQNPNDRPIGMKFEVVDLNKVPTVGAKILMTGYGCSDSGARKYFDERLQRDRYIGYVQGSSDGFMRVGDAKITHTKSHPYFQNLPRTQAIVESHALVGGPGAKLCPGDSGGPVFSGISQVNQQGARRIIGVNSSVGGIVSDSLPVTIISNLVDFNDVTIQSFFADFVQSNGVDICGYNKQPGSGSCRQ